MKVLCVGGEGVTNNGLYILSKLCQQLQVLELVNTPLITTRLATAITKAGLKELRLLELDNTSITQGVSVRSL